MIKEYLVDPIRFWPETHRRNAKKIEKFLSSACGSKNKADIERYVDDLFALAQLRRGFEKKHLYLVNAGSSGSHWVEAMLSLLPGFYNGGEIYLPNKILSYLSTLSSEEADVALDAIYLAHTAGVFKDSLFSSISNSAHVANHSKISRFSKDRVAVLLLRNPIDVVVSRTFRKNEYKSDVAPSLNEKEYLEKNCSYVENFYKGIDLKSFDLVVKYEDFLVSPKTELAKLADLLEISVCNDELDNAVLRTSKSEEGKAISKGEVPLTNVYLGERSDYSWAKAYLSKRLVRECETYKSL